MKEKQNISLSIQEKNGNAVPPSVISEKKTINIGLTAEQENKILRYLVEGLSQQIKDLRKEVYCG